MRELPKLDGLAEAVSARLSAVTRRPLTVSGFTRRGIAWRDLCAGFVETWRRL